MEQKIRNARKILEKNKERSDILDIFCKLYDCLSPEHFIRALWSAENVENENDIVTILVNIFGPSSILNEEERTALKPFLRELPKKYKDLVLDFQKGVGEMVEIMSHNT